MLWTHCVLQLIGDVFTVFKLQQINDRSKFVKHKMCTGLHVGYTCKALKYVDLYVSFRKKCVFFYFFHGSIYI